VSKYESISVKVNGKDYAVRVRPDGCVDIIARWEAFNIAERNFVRALTISRSCYVSPYGRLGKKVIKAANINIDSAWGRVVNVEAS